MQDPGQEPGGDDEGLAWRHDLALKLLRALLVIFTASAIVVWFSLERVESRNRLALAALAAAAIVAVPAFSERPRGPVRAWLIIVPALATAVAGYAFVGTLSGPGVCLTVT